VLEDPRGKFLADHEVDLTDDTSDDAKAFRGLTGYLHYYRKIKKPEEVLASLGAWMGERIFWGAQVRVRARWVGGGLGHRQEKSPLGPPFPKGGRPLPSPPHLSPLLERAGGGAPP